jgi:biotin carboxyl carrier protein
MSTRHQWVRLGKEVRSIAVSRIGDKIKILEADAQPLEAQILERDGSWMRLSLNGRTIAGFARRVANKVTIVWRGRQFVVEDLPAGAPEGQEGTARLEIEAPMTGTIRQLLCEVGDCVAAGAPLLTLEAMKMEHRLVSEGAARVKEVLVKTDDRVDIGQILVRLEGVTDPL